MVPNTVILNVTVTDLLATRDRDIADALSTQFTGLVTELETPTGGTVAAGPSRLRASPPARTPRP